MTAKSSGRTGTLPWIPRLLAPALGFVLAYSSLAQLESPMAFLDTVYSYDLLGVEAGLAVATLLPFGQLCLAVSLVFGIWPREVFGLSFLLFCGFVAAQSLVYSRGQEISCGCFGANGPRIGWQTLSVTGSCAIAAAVGLLLSVGRSDEENKSNVPAGVLAG